MQMVRRISIRWLILMIGLIILIPSQKSYAQTTFEKVYIDEIQTAQDQFLKDDIYYQLYQVKGYTFIGMSTLEKMGFEINEIEGIKSIQLPHENVIGKAETSVLSGKVYMAPQPVYCGNIRSYTLAVDDERLLPIEVLKAVGLLKYEDGVYWLEEDFQNPLMLVEINENGITNITDHIMKLSYVQLYWNGKAYETTEAEVLLEAGESIQWQSNNDPKKLYITTLIQEMSDFPIPEALEGQYGQSNEVIFKHYSDSIYLEELSHVFPQCIIEGQMKYPVGTLKEKEMVEVCRSEKHYYFSVKDQAGNKYQVPYNSVRVIGEKGARLGKVSKEKIEDFATLSQIESATDYLLWTDLYRQRTYVLKRDGERWCLEQSFVCSTGKMNNPTPTGMYEVQYMIPYIGVQKGYRCKYAMVFFRDYMYHSILFDKTGQYIKSGQYELGSKASHGCVRLSEKDSYWLYTHIPVKTKVWIR